MHSPTPEALSGATWPFPLGICTRCLLRVLKDDPEVRKRLLEFQKALNKRMLSGAGEAMRSGVLNVMSWADLVVKRFGGGPK
ncbi:MAG TPA: hypothetical protein VGQ18_08325 [Gemmatimonadales bacterium]|jgi:hypothetical protein|nr:hypothetical protein [Gemmatimonadales bacterium]